MFHFLLSALREVNTDHDATIRCKNLLENMVEALQEVFIGGMATVTLFTDIVSSCFVVMLFFVVRIFIDFVNLTSSGFTFLSSGFTFLSSGFTFLGCTSAKVKLPKFSNLQISSNLQAKQYG